MTGRASGTRVEIRGEDFWIGGEPTYRGRVWRGQRIEGLLFNSRMVQATFDDLNPDTRHLWAYPDSGVWDPERNVREFVGMVPEYRRHGLLGVTVNFQGGHPRGYHGLQPWINTAFTAFGELRPASLERMRRVLDALDAHGVVAIVGLYYFGQDERLYDEAAVRRGVENAVGWLLDGGWRNVIVEVNNECNVRRYEHEILQPHRVHELIAQVRGMTRDGRRLLVGTSYGGRAIPDESVLAASDLALVHGNGVTDPIYIGEMVRQTRERMGNALMPVVFNEDDHFAFDQPVNNLLVATAHHASWGYYDPGEGAGGRAAVGDYVEGYQNVPANWGINTARKRGFFSLINEISGA